MKSASSSGPTRIDFNCDECHLRIRARSTMSGRDMNCPRCGRSCRIPGQCQPPESERRKPGGTTLRSCEEAWAIARTTFWIFLLVCLLSSVGRTVWLGWPRSAGTPERLAEIGIWVIWFVIVVVVADNHGWVVWAVTGYLGFLIVCFAAFWLGGAYRGPVLQGWAGLSALSHVIVFCIGLWCIHCLQELRRARSNAARLPG